MPAFLQVWACAYCLFAVRGMGLTTYINRPNKDKTYIHKMTSLKQRDELQAAIWRIANDVRGAVDGWDFKQFVLGTLFYRFISENLCQYMENGDDQVHYAQMADENVSGAVVADAITSKGYMIYPSQLFVNVAKHAQTNPNLNTDLSAIFSAIEGSANGICLRKGGSFNISLVDEYISKKWRRYLLCHTKNV